VQVGDYIKFAVDTLKSGAQVIKSITEVARAWGRYHQEKADAAAAAAAAEAERLAAQQEADEAEAQAQNRRINQEDAEAREAARAAREAAGLTGDFDIDIPTDPNVVAANQTAAETAFGEQMGSFPAEQMLEPDPGGLFHGDLDRGMELTLGGETVPNKPENENLNSNQSKEAVGKKADDMFADFLTGGNTQAFADLTPEEQQQIRILEALCTQRREIVADREGRNSILGYGHNEETYDFPDAEDPPASRKCTVTRNGDDFVIDYSGTVHKNMIMSADSLMPTFLDPNTSVQTVSGRLTIPKAELARLGSLNFAGVDINNLPDNYKLHFLETYLKSTLSLNKPQP
jgi:hypothetical protein